MANTEIPTITEWTELRRRDVMTELVAQGRPPVMTKGQIDTKGTIGNRKKDVEYWYVPPRNSTLRDRVEGPVGGVKKFVSYDFGKGVVIGEASPLILTPVQGELIRHIRGEALRSRAEKARRPKVTSSSTSAPAAPTPVAPRQTRQFGHGRGAW